MPKCDEYPIGTRKRAICDGVIDMPLEKINFYRQQGGWPPLTEKPETTFVVQQPPTVVFHAKSSQPGHSRPDTSSSIPTIKQPGSRLKEAFAKWHAESCPICDGLAAQMDHWKAEGCRQNLDYLVRNISERGNEWFEKHLPAFNDLFAVTRSTAIRNIGIRFQIKRMVLKAIKDTEAEEAEQKKNVRET